MLAEVSPRSTPFADGRFGDRSPSRYGSSVSPSAPGEAVSASAENPVASTPSSRPVTSSTRAAFTVATSGRNFPVASAKPATSPDGSAVGLAVTA